MNALAFVRELIADTRQRFAAGDVRVGRPDRKWTSHFDSLSATQQQAVIAYIGDDTVGNRGDYEIDSARK